MSRKGAARRLFFFFGVLLAAGCTPLESMRRWDPPSGQAYLLQAPRERVRLAAIRALVELKYEVSMSGSRLRLFGTEYVETGYVYASVAVDVEAATPETTRVVVMTRPSSIFSVFNRDWGPEVKARIDDNLRRDLPSGDPSSLRCMMSEHVEARYKGVRRPRGAQAPDCVIRVDD
jgi:hypothetical protein